MKRIVLYIAALCATLMLPTSVRADFSHNFDDKTFARTLENVDAHHTRSTDDGIVYTLGGTADCYKDWQHRTGTGGKICLNLFKTGDYIITSPAINKLSEITIYHNADITDNILNDNKISVQLSKDSTDWTSITPTLDFQKDKVYVLAPYQDSYYVKITSLSGTDISILKIDYIITDCNCFRYTP